MDASGPLLALGGFGLLTCFAGYRVFRLALVLLGVWIGGVLGAALGSAVAPGTSAFVVGGAVIGGVVLGWLAVAFFFAAVAVFGAGLCATVAAMVLSPAGWITQALGAVLAAVVGGLLAVAVQRLVIMIGTAVHGALGAVLAGAVLAGEGSVADYHAKYTLIMAAAERPDRVLGHGALVFAWAVLAAAGVLVQFAQAARAGAADAPETPER